MARLANFAPMSARSRRRGESRRSFGAGVASLVAVTGALVVVAEPTGAAVPGTPGTPVVVAIPGGVGLRWSAPTNVGSPALTRYRVEMNRGGTGWSPAPVRHVGTAMTPAYQHSCAMSDNGSVKCWGQGLYGQPGAGDTQARGDGPGEMGDSLPAVNLGTGRKAVEISAEASDTCALLDNGTVKCWGANFYGSLGLGDTAHRGDGPGEMGDNLPAVALGTGRTAVAISNSYGHPCVLLDNGSVKCWGYNTIGYLGLGDTAHRGDGPGEMGDNLPAVSLGTGRTAIDVAAGGDHVCVLLDNRSVKCWGANFWGQLGVGDQIFRGDGPGEMGDNLPAVDLGTGRTAVADRGRPPAHVRAVGQRLGEVLGPQRRRLAWAGRHCPPRRRAG